MRRTLLTLVTLLVIVGCQGRRGGTPVNASDAAVMADAGLEVDARMSDAAAAADMAVLPPARTCSEPESLSLTVGGSLRLTGEIPAGEGTTESACDLAEAKEQVYMLRTSARGRLIGSVTAGGGVKSLYIRAVCSGTDFSCYSTRFSSELVVPVLPAGDWYLFVDGRSEGPYDVSLRLDPLLPGENCDAVEDLGTLEVDNALEVSGSVGAYGSDSVGSCATFYRVYEVRVPTPGQLGAIVSASEDFSVMIAEGPSCSAASELVCRSNSAGVDAEVGSYWIWVGRGTGSYSMSIGLSAD